MSESEALGPVACPQCGAANAPVAKFCGSCGVPMKEGQAPPPTPAPAPRPPPPPPPPPRGIDFSQFSGGGGAQVRVELDAATAFEQVVAAIQVAKATISWHAPPHNAKFELAHKDYKNLGGVTVRYNGELTVSEVSPTASLVGLEVKVDWGSMVPVFISAAVLAVIFVMFMPLFFGYLIILVMVLSGYFGWVFGSKIPGEYREKFTAGLPRATSPTMPGGAGPQAGSGQDAPAAGWRDRLKQVGGALSTPGAGSGAAAGWADKLKQVGRVQPTPPGPAPEPPASPVQQAPAAAPTVADRIKQLSALLEDGLITQEDFAAKKAKLLEEL